MHDADPSNGDRESSGVDTVRDGPHDRAAVDANGIDARLTSLELADAVEGYVPRVDYDSLGFRTVIIRIDAEAGAASGLASELQEGPGVTVYRVAGRFDVFAVCRFLTTAACERAIANLATDNRVRAHRASVVRHIVGEADTLPLVADD